MGKFHLTPSSLRGEHHMFMTLGWDKKKQFASKMFCNIFPFTKITAFNKEKCED